MSVYVIYHVVGVKVGCSKQFEQRCAENRAMYGVDIQIVELEEFAGDDASATEREAHWARELGYSPGTPYDQAIDARRISGKRGGRTAAQSPRHNSKDEKHQAKWTAGGQRIANAVVVCPHCRKSGQSRSMMRWHFDRCRQRPAA